MDDEHKKQEAADEQLINNAFQHLLESYLGMVCDDPQAYLGQPGFEFIQQVPCTWDQTVVPAAELMEYACVARRSGDDWWVGAINNSTARTIPCPLDFLTPGVRYKAEIWADAPDADRHPNHLIRKTLVVTSDDTLPLALAASGGSTLHIYPE